VPEPLGTTETPTAPGGPEAPETAAAQTAAPASVTDAETLPIADDGLKPAEREARALREKEYVTPPVDVDEGPRGLAEWVAYAVQAVGHSASTFKEALDDYDRRRGRKSGAASSYGCVVAAAMGILAIVLIVLVVSYVSSHR
jgi:hypothetical protein